MSPIHNLWHVIKSRTCQNHGISHSDFHNGGYQDNCVKNRTAQIFTLEIVLHEHRKKFATIFEPLKGADALYHLVFTKTLWKPSEIKQLPFADCLFVIQDELRIDKLPDNARTFIESLNLPEVAFTFDQQLEEDWDYKENSVFLKDLG